MATARFELDPDFETAILRSEGLRAYLTPLVEAGVAIAKDRFPRRLGYLEDSVEGVVGVDRVRDETGNFSGEPRMIGRIIAKDFKVIWSEFGTVKLPKRPGLRPAIESIGGNFQPGTRR